MLISLFLYLQKLCISMKGRQYYFKCAQNKYIEYKGFLHRM
jgi:hypothetical protein